MFSTVPYVVSPVTLAGPQLPTEARVPQEVERRLVLLPLGRRDQGGEDDPGAATVDDVMVLVPQPRACVAVWHRRGVRIGRADAEIGRPPIGSRAWRADWGGRPAVSHRDAVRRARPGQPAPSRSTFLATVRGRRRLHRLHGHFPHHPLRGLLL